MRNFKMTKLFKTAAIAALITGMRQALLLNYLMAPSWLRRMSLCQFSNPAPRSAWLALMVYLKYTPEIPFQGQDTDNKIDEVRITAAAEGYSHVIIYGVGPDASWASFGGKALRETGLTIHDGCDSWQKAKAKALLVNAHTGEVLGAATAENIEFNIGELADNVGNLVTKLSEA